MDEREIPILRLEEVRTGVLTHEPGTAVITVRAGGGELRRYFLTVPDLARLAKQLAADATLLAG